MKNSWVVLLLPAIFLACTGATRKGSAPNGGAHGSPPGTRAKEDRKQASSGRELPQSYPVGMVERVKGRVRYVLNQQSPPAGELIRNGQLVKANGPVCSGWILLCEPGSELVIRYNRRSKVPVGPHKSVYRYRVPFIPIGSGPLDSVLVRTGRKQAAGGRLFSPPQGGRVWPAQVVFRWTPLEVGTTLSLFLRRWPEPVLEEPAIWEETFKEDGTGAYTSAAARKQLMKLQEQQPTAKFRLTLTIEDGKGRGGQTVVFNLLSNEDEARLQEELRSCEGEEGPMRHIARASTFQQYRLFAEAAEEMEKALAMSPDSGMLRIGTIWAHRRSGNRAAEERHLRLLPSGTKIPGD